MLLQNSQVRRIQSKATILQWIAKKAKEKEETSSITDNRCDQCDPCDRSQEPSTASKPQS